MNQTTILDKNGNVNRRLNRLTVETAQFADKQTIADVTDNLLSNMRPTLIVCLGGTGQETAVHLKALLTQRFGGAWHHKVRLLAFDTTEEPVSVPLAGKQIRLEAGSEFFNMGHVPVGNIIRNLDNLDAIRDRLGPTIHRLPPAFLRTGAKQIRALGLLALLWHYGKVKTQLQRAVWALAGRDVADTQSSIAQQQGINIFIICSLAGGTGSGTFLDIAYMSRSLVAELGEQREFCHVTGIGILPQAFRHVRGPNLMANTGAALQELNHAMMQGGFRVNCPDGTVLDVPDSPFNLFYVLDGVDERGNTWTGGIQDVTAMAAHGIFLQMASQLGRKGDNAFDNVDQVLSGRTEDGSGTYLASQGVGYLHFPAHAVVELCGRRLLQEMLSHKWLHDADREKAAGTATQLLQPVTQSQLNAELLHDPQTGGELRVDLRRPAWLAQKPVEQIASETGRFISDYGHARVNEMMRGQVRENGAALGRKQQPFWQTWVDQNLFAPDISLKQIDAVLQAARTTLSSWIQTGQRQMAEKEEHQNQQEAALSHLLTAVGAAADSLFIGRKARVQDALERCFRAGQAFYEGQVEQAKGQAHLQLWAALESQLMSLQNQVHTLIDRLYTVQEQSAASLPVWTKQLEGEGVSHISLADEALVAQLYSRYAPEQVNLMQLIAADRDADHQSAPDLLSLAGSSTEQVGSLILNALKRSFQPILAISVEQIMAEQSATMSPQARRQQLFRMATPSWSVDRARLPEGGARLERLQVLGVPDSRNTHFGDEPMLVATQDPYRLIALTVVAGAPASALQQYTAYQQRMEQADVPLYVLPHFLSANNQGPLAFALGSIFGLIESEGSHFYYRPGDTLLEPRRLGQGVANAITAVSGDESLVRELLDRVDSRIARLGSQRSIEVLKAYYTAVPEGRSRLDEQTRELKRLVRDYTEELRQIDAFNTGMRES